LLFGPLVNGVKPTGWQPPASPVALVVAFRMVRAENRRAAKQPLPTYREPFRRPPGGR